MFDQPTDIGAKRLLGTVLLGALLTAGASAETSVQAGSLSGYEEPGYQDIVLDQFDSQGGTRQLNAVQIDVLTAIIAGGTTPGSGGPPTSVYIQLDADYFLGQQTLAETQAVVDTQVFDNGLSFTLFDNDSAETILVQPLDIAPWIGDGHITLTAFTQLIVEQDPPDSLSLGIGGSVDYTVTYEYEVLSLPGDVNDDGIVDINDLVGVITAWGACGAECPADLDGDGVVDVNDLVLVILHWS